MIEEIVFLGTKDYEESGDKRYGDCVIINAGDELIIYDCGSEEHAKQVLKYMEQHGFKELVIVLSHNDSDHFDGIPYLVESGVVKGIYTTLLFKYAEEIEKILDDDRRNKHSVIEAIKKKYDNIASLSGTYLYDIYENTISLPSGIAVVGPEKSYMLNAVAKCINEQDGDTTDGETNVNATSIQVKVKVCGHEMLLCGDSAFAAIKNNIRDCDVIQLPHHGKDEQAQEIFDAKEDTLNTYYIVSDNTGNTNGGSDNTDFTGHKVFNTKEMGNIKIDEWFFNVHGSRAVGRLG